MNGTMQTATEARLANMKERVVQIIVAMLVVVGALLLWGAISQSEAAERKSGSSSRSTSHASSMAQSGTVVAGSTTHYNSSSGLRVQYEDGHLEVSEHGEPVPDERILRNDEYILVMDDDGRVVYQILLDEHGGVAWSGNLLSATPRRRSSGLRIGISMGHVGEAMAAQLGINEERSILVRHVDRDGPANEAGLEHYDIITGIDGTDSARARDLRRRLREMEEGDTLQLAVLRRGETLTVELKPERGSFGVSAYAWGDNSDAYDAWKSAAALAPGAPYVYTVPDADVPLAFSPDGNSVMVMPPRAPESPEPVRDPERLRRLEDRLERLEAMLERLLEKQEQEGDGR